MAKNVALNPASVPFFPGLKPAEGEDSVEYGRGQHGLDMASTISSVSAVSSMNESYRSAKSSPSPSQQAREPNRALSPVPPQAARSPLYRPVDGSGNRPFTVSESKPTRGTSTLGVMGTLPEGEDVPDFSIVGSKPGTPASLHQDAFNRSLNQSPPVPPTATLNRSLNQSPPVAQTTALNRNSNQSPTAAFNRNMNQSPPVAPNVIGGGSSWTTASLKSTSPVSSLDSGSQTFFTNIDPQAFEQQLKASPFIADLLDRLARCEVSTRQIQTDLSAVHRKVNFLVDQALAKAQVQPEFNDPFAPSPATNGLGSSISHNPLGPRPSIGNIAPNQRLPGDEMTHVVNHLNALTTSVGQLIALKSTIPVAPNASNFNSRKSTPTLGGGGMDIPPNQMVPPLPQTNLANLGHGRPDLRPNPRQPNPMRTWSAGTLDLPIRGSEPNIGRVDSLAGGKRRSVAGLLRRDSSGLLDDSRDGPVISKWEQLSLAPELLRSLSKFGIGPPNKIQQRALPFLLRGADIIAQAPPTQERIAAYVIPAIQVAVTHLHLPLRGPLVIMVSTTVDQATQAQRMIRDIGGPIGVRSALGVGTTNVATDLTQEIRLLHQNKPHIICGTPQKLDALFTAPGGLQGSDVRFLVLDEVDQLIARNLHDFVFNIVKLLPSPRRPPGTNPVGTPNASQTSPAFTSPFDTAPNAGRRPSFVPSPAPGDLSPTQVIERQTALFSNTVPQDVLNLASAINLREPVRVLVRRDGNVSSNEPTQGSRGLRQYYLYLAFTSGGRSDSVSTNSQGLGIIGSGRSGGNNAETAQAREWKLEALGDLVDDAEANQIIVHVGGMAALDAVVYKLASRGAEAIPLHGEMNAGTKLAALNKFRAPGPSIITRPTTKVLVVYDVQVKNPDVPHVPLVINYDLPKAVEEYAHRVVPAIAPNYSRAGVVINFVTATGGDVEMLRSIECFYKIKCPEVPMSLRDIL